MDSEATGVPFGARRPLIRFPLTQLRGVGSGSQACAGARPGLGLLVGRAGVGWERAIPSAAGRRVPAGHVPLFTAAPASGAHFFVPAGVIAAARGAGTMRMTPAPTGSALCPDIVVPLRAQGPFLVGGRRGRKKKKKDEKEQWRQI